MKNFTLKIINGTVSVQIWEDEEPMSIKKILKDCDVVENGNN